MPVFLAFGQEYYRWVDDQGAIHFSDNLHSIPERFRSQAEKRSQPAVRAPAGSVPEYPSGRSQPAVIVVPFKRQGNLMIVDGTINQSVPVKFILDTGAEISIIPLSVAPRLGIQPGSAIFITMTGIGGSVEVPLVEVESVSVGGAEVRNLEVTLSNTPLPDTGLLGADFLSDYKVDIKYAANQVILEPVERPYGGHTFEWWQKKFRMYLAIKRHYEAARAKAGPRAANEVLESQLRAVDQKISELEGRASQAGIPREFRQ